MTTDDTTAELLSAPDPADTLSGNLPSLQPPEWTPGHYELGVLDPRFPIRLSQPATIFWQLTAEWDDRETVITQTIRATQQHTIPEERFVQPLPETAPVPAIAAPVVVYPQLGEAELAHEWDTGPGLAVPAAVGEPQRHRRRGPGGRFISREAS